MKMPKPSMSQSINNLRVIAIIGIVFHHSNIGLKSSTVFEPSYLIYNQLFNYGTFIFIFVSGFLFQKQINKYSTLQLFERKSRTILLPYLFFTVPWLLYCIVNFSLTTHYDNATFSNLKNSITLIFFRSNYWFVINLMLIQGLNIFLKSHKQVILSTLIFFLITLFYSLNTHLRLFNPMHTHAYLGFFSFFGLGRLFRLYANIIRKFLDRYILNAKRYQVALYIFVLLSFFWLAILESIYIHSEAPHTDCTNILRFSNIVLTFLFLAGIYRLRFYFKFSKRFSNKSIYMIYLVHYYILLMGGKICQVLHFQFDHFTYLNIPLNFIWGVVVLYSSLIVSEQILRLKLFKALFNQPEKRPAIELKQQLV